MCTSFLFTVAARGDSMGEKRVQLRFIFEKHVGPVEGDCSIQVIRKNWHVQLYTV